MSKKCALVFLYRGESEKINVYAVRENGIPQRIVTKFRSLGEENSMTACSLNDRTGNRRQSAGIRRLLVADMGTQDYASALAFQRRLHDLRRQDLLREDIFLLTEHEPVFTLGRNAGVENLLVSRAFLEERGVSLFSTERGGDITYHGPGQLVGYPILKIPGQGRHVKAYVRTVEEVLIHTLSAFGIEGITRPGKPGIWVHDSKIAFIGIAVKQGVSFHGFALNVDLDLSPFSWIHPCGLRNTAITRVKDLLDCAPSMQEIKATLSSAISSRMRYIARWVTTKEMEELMTRGATLSHPTPGILQNDSKA